MDRTRVRAICTDSCITSPNWPVTISCPDPSTADVSIKRISPPACVQARPVTTPGRASSIRLSWRIPLPSRNSGRRFALTVMLFWSPLTNFTAAWRHSTSICFFSPRTPDSAVYSLIIASIASSVTFSADFLMPMASIALGRRCFLAIWNFSTAVYPGKEITSIRFKRGSGIVSVTLAVHTNSTSDRS